MDTAINQEITVGQAMRLYDERRRIHITKNGKVCTAKEINQLGAKGVKLLALNGVVSQ